MKGLLARFAEKDDDDTDQRGDIGDQPGGEKGLFTSFALLDGNARRIDDREFLRVEFIRGSALPISQRRHRR